jgi:NAD(P)-dependent dehydrogenase (short-subunit alcohol dehydrogenase family)
MGLMSRGWRPKKLRDQTIVITGGSSGIGLATARVAAARGARVVVTSRNEQDLKRAADEINARGGRAVYAVADVAEPGDLDRVAETAIREFGGFDTWVNDAGISIYGKLTEVPLEDKKRLFDTNFWGVVNGCRTAVRHLRDKGGMVINIGSIVSDRAVPMQGIYSASKHAVLGYTDALRMELEHDRLPIIVTLVKPAAINTPFVEHARNYMDKAPSLPPPVYAPEVVADAIVRCAERRVREITVGGGGRVMSVMGKVAPRTMDKYMEQTMFSQQQDTTGTVISQDSLFEAKEDGHATGPYPGHVMQTSLYTNAKLSKVTRVLPYVAAGAVLAATVHRWRSDAA